MYDVTSVPPRGVMTVRWHDAIICVMSRIHMCGVTCFSLALSLPLYIVCEMPSEYTYLIIFDDTIRWNV